MEGNPEKGYLSYFYGCLGMIIREVLESLIKFFTNKGLEMPRVDAEWMMAAVLKKKRLDLFLHYEDVVSEKHLNTLREWACRRGRREPLQYILGNVDFYGQFLKVDRRVLIPRPETEELIFQLQRYWKDATCPEFCLDLGTGSGAIAITLAQLYPEMQLVASDKSSEALALAKENARLNHVDDRISFCQSDWFQGIDGQTFDWIVSNPPYLTEKEWTEAQDEVRVFEPKQALVAPENGLSDLKVILKDAFVHLTNGGGLVLETGIAQHEFLHALAKDFGYKRSLSSCDLLQRKRFFWAWKA